MVLLSPSSAVSVSADQRTAYWSMGGQTWFAPINADGSLGDQQPTSDPEIKAGLMDLPQVPDAPGWPVPGQPVVLFPATDPATDGVFWLSPAGDGLAYASRVVADAAAAATTVATTLPTVLAASTEWDAHVLGTSLELDDPPGVPAVLSLQHQGDHLDLHRLLAAIRNHDPRTVPQFVVHNALNKPTTWQHGDRVATVEIFSPGGDHCPSPAELYVSPRGAAVTFRFILDFPWNAQRAADEGQPHDVWDLVQPLLHTLGFIRESTRTE